MWSERFVPELPAACELRVGLVPTVMAEKLKALERENRELRQANEIFARRQASNLRLAASAISDDNALAETINGLYKAELIHRRARWRSIRSRRVRDVERGSWFNKRRLLEPIGNIPPAEAEQRYYAMLDNQPWQRDLKSNGLRRTRGGLGVASVFMQSTPRP